jgi:hypothetical protein
LYCLHEGEEDKETRMRMEKSRYQKLHTKERGVNQSERLKTKIQKTIAGRMQSMDTGEGGGITFTCIENPQ